MSFKSCFLCNTCLGTRSIELMEILHAALFPDLPCLQRSKTEAGDVLNWIHTVSLFWVRYKGRGGDCLEVCAHYPLSGVYYIPHTNKRDVHMLQLPMYDLRTCLGRRLHHSPPAAQRTAR